MQLFSTRTFGLALIFIASVLLSVPHQSAVAVTIPTTPVGNAGNPADETGYGAVDYQYAIGTTEVTNAQYVEFLNAVAKTDTYGLFNSWGGITRSGTSGRYVYSVMPAFGSYTFADKPVVNVSWGDAARFCNWLHNGQPVGRQDGSTTEAGAYTLNGAVGRSALLAVARNPDANWFIPSSDEWYKAAYYDAATNDYFEYPTGSNTEPNNNPPSMDTGNSANFNLATGSFDNRLADAGAYKLSGSPYGTYDQGGNVWEWNEDLAVLQSRVVRGGSFGSYFYWQLQSTYTDFREPNQELPDVGFRVAGLLKPGDANLDGIVDGADYIVWADHFLQTGQKWQAGDFTGDGIVDGADYTVWADHFAPGTLSLSAVPEPSTLALAAIGALALSVTVARRRLA